MKYVVIGPYPPPLGGVSVYVYRYAKMLKDRGDKVQIVDIGKGSKLRKILTLFKLAFNPGRKIFYLNGSDLYAMAALVIRPFPGKIIYHDHSGRAIDSFNRCKLAVLRLFLKRVNECYIVGEHLREFYDRRGCRLPQNTQVRHAFLPPPPEDEALIWKTYEPETIEFIESHKPLIVANAYKITFYKDIDLYGLDMCVDLVAKLKETYSQIGLLFALADIGDDNYYARINQKIDELGIRDHFHFMTRQKELWPLYKKSDLLVRPTCTDGDAVSIREALLLDCPVVASNVCKRPENTQLFDNRNLASLVNETMKILASKELA